MGRTLVVDLDGSLSNTDSLYESLTTLGFTKPWVTVRLLFKSLRLGKAWLKSELENEVKLDILHSPYNELVLKKVSERRAQGDDIFLATGATDAVARKHYEHLELFDGYFASNKERNLTGDRKAKLLIEEFGERGFDYVGNSRADLNVWTYAHTALVVSRSRSLARAAATSAIEVEVINNTKSKFQSMIKEVRPHQWVKNLLVLVPFLLAHEDFSLSAGIDLLLSFTAFSFVASSVYVINDLFDRDNDRKHHSKRDRPIASGLLTIPQALILAVLLIAAGMAAALWVSGDYLAFLGVYFLLTCIYTFWGKRQVVLDVVLLAILYTSRIFGGMIALDLDFSFWLFSFSIFTFLSLAFLKRFSELHSTKANQDGRAELNGRGYRWADEIAVLAMGVASAYTGSLILALYLNSEEVVTMYAHPNYLWFMLPVFIFWVSRIWILGFRGLVDSDPVLFAVRDRTTYLVAILASAILFLSANGVPFA